MDAKALRVAADANSVLAFDRLTPALGHPAAGRRRFGAAEAVLTGAASAFWNPVFAFSDDVTTGDLDAAIDWIEGNGLRAFLHISDDLDTRLLAHVRARGFELDDWPTPVMVLDPIPPDMPPSPAGVTLRAGGVELIESWYQANEAPPVMRELLSAAVLDDPGVILAVAFLEGVPVAGAMAMDGAGLIGIYAVGTVESARRRGIGRAVTWAAIQAGARRWGHDVAILQSSAMGVPVYEAMGFRATHRYLELKRPLPAAAAG